MPMIVGIIITRTQSDRNQFNLQVESEGYKFCKPQQLAKVCFYYSASALAANIVQ